MLVQKLTLIVDGFPGLAAKNDADPVGKIGSTSDVVTVVTLPSAYVCVIVIMDVNMPRFVGFGSDGGVVVLMLGVEVELFIA
jgi:hypothetical protein